MKVKDILAALEGNDPEEELIIAWWERTGFDEDLSEDEWNNFVYKVDQKMDWSYTHDTLNEMKYNADNG